MTRFLTLGRKAIVEGLKESIDEFQQTIPGTSAKHVMNLVLVTQYYDALKEIGANNKSNTLLLPSTPDGTKAFGNLIQENVLSGQLAANVQNNVKDDDS